MSSYSDWNYLWISHFLKFAKPIETLPFGWCVYREAIDFE